MGRKKQLKKNEVLEAIHNSRGFVSTVAAKLHVDWHTAKDAIERWPETQQAIKDEEETTLDFVEGKAITKINEGDGAMIRFYLATKGKKRGYTYEEEQNKDNLKTEDDEPLTVICDGEEVDPINPAAAGGDE